jgi:hypothetical protein
MSVSFILGLISNQVRTLGEAEREHNSDIRHHDGGRLDEYDPQLDR